MGRSLGGLLLGYVPKIKLDNLDSLDLANIYGLIEITA